MSMTTMEVDTEVLDDDFLFYSLLYSSITVLFGMAVLSKFLTNEFRFGFRSFLSLIILFIGEPLCHFLLRGPTGVFIFGLGCLLVYSVLPASHLPAKGKSVLITGCDSGCGHALVQKLDLLGMRVFAGCLRKDSLGAVQLRNCCSDRVTVLQMDVTKETEVTEAFEYISAKVGEDGLWGLVNNASIWYISDIGMTSEKMFRKVMEVNLFGTVHVTQKFMPLLRLSKGRVVNMSSVSAKFPLGGISAYCASKSAIEVFSDCLRLEMRPWGMHVSLVEPLGYKSGAAVDSANHKKEEVWEGMSEDAQNVYGREYLDHEYERYELFSSKWPNDLTPVVRCMRSGLLSKKPLRRYVVGCGARTLLIANHILPLWFTDWLALLLGFTPQDISPASVQN